jgi:hypothetical protein
MLLNQINLILLNKFLLTSLIPPSLGAYVYIRRPWSVEEGRLGKMARRALSSYRNWAADLQVAEAADPEPSKISRSLYLLLEYHVSISPQIMPEINRVRWRIVTASATTVGVALVYCSTHFAGAC